VKQKLDTILGNYQKFAGAFSLDRTKMILGVFRQSTSTYALSGLKICSGRPECDQINISAYFLPCAWLSFWSKGRFECFTHWLLQFAVRLAGKFVMQGSIFDFMIIYIFQFSKKDSLHFSIIL